MPLQWKGLSMDPFEYDVSAPFEYDVFISYSRADNKDGWVSALRDAIYEDFKGFSSEPFRIFFDTEEIHIGQDWEQRLLQAVRTSRVLVVCVSRNYLRSDYCRQEWAEFQRMQARRFGGGDPVTGVFFVEWSDDRDDEAVAAWRHQVTRVQLVDLRPWFPDGVEFLQKAEVQRSLQETEVRQRVKELGEQVHAHLQQARRANEAPGNLGRYNPGFVGRLAELRALRHELTKSGVGVVTAVHGLGGIGKTELAVAYARHYAHTYQGGTWRVDADRDTDMLEAISRLAKATQLGLEVREEHLRDRQWLGRVVLARLEKLTAAARQQDEGSAACLLLLDNVSEPTLLSASQLAVLPQEPWFHVAVTTRMGLSDIGAAGSRASVAMIEVGPLNTEDGLALIREHQPARDPEKLHPDFSSAQEEDAARLIVELLDGYTLAVEQTAVYLGSFAVEPSRLLGQLRERGVAFLDEVGGLPVAEQAILHKEKMAAAIVDQTLDRLPDRARATLTVASMLPADTIPWDWLEQLTETPGATASHALPGLSGDDWASTHRVLVGRRLLTPADDPGFGRLHRVLQAHLRTRLAHPEIERRLDTFLQHISEHLHEAPTPDTAQLAVTAIAIAGRLADGRPDLGDAGLGLIEQVQTRVDLATAQTLATATLNTYQRLAKSDPRNIGLQRNLWTVTNRVADILLERGDARGALQHYADGLHIAEQLAESDSHHQLSTSLNRVGDVLASRGDAEAALPHYTRALQIRERLAETEPQSTGRQRELFVSLKGMGDLLVGRNAQQALQHYTRALEIAEWLADTDPQHARWQLDLSGILNSVGDVLVRRDASRALALYTRALHIRERIAESDPRNSAWKRDMSASLDRVGQALVQGGDREGALTQFSRAVEILEGLTESDPLNTRWEGDLSVGLMKIANLLAQRGDAAAALQHFTHALQIAEHLVEIDSQNTRWQHNLCYGLDKAGDLLANSGDAAAALRHHTRSFNIAERLADTDPLNTELQHELCLSLDRVGNGLAKTGDARAALEHFARGLRIAEQLTRIDPDNAVWQRDLWMGLCRAASVLESTGGASAYDYWARAGRVLVSLDAAGKLPDDDRYVLDYVTNKLGKDSPLPDADGTDDGNWVAVNAADAEVREDMRKMWAGLNRMGDMSADRGDTQVAVQHYTAALQIAEQIADANPHDTYAQQDLSENLDKVGNALARRGDTTDALQHYTRALQIDERLAALDPHDAGVQRALTVSFVKVGDVLATLGDAAGALKHFVRSMRVIERLVASDPHDTEWQHDLCVSLERVGDALAKGDDKDGALQCYTKALHVCERLVEADPQNTGWQRDLSRSFERVGDVLAKDDDTADALDHYTRSLHIRERLTQIDPQNAGGRRDVAVSHFKIASTLDSAGAGSAMDHWAQVRRIFEELDAAGGLSENDRKVLGYVDAKLGQK
jgi:tetratricopeptide (TPR) repeat protein